MMGYPLVVAFLALLIGVYGAWQRGFPQPSELGWL